jgi:hypothetical protein
MLTPAYAIRELFIRNGLGSATFKDDWFITVAYLPDNSVSKDKIIAITDTEGNYDGRIFRSGDVIIHPGLQIRVRSIDYMEGYQKMTSINKWIDAFKGEKVVINNDSLIILTVNRQTGIMPMGQDSHGRRFNFSTNYILTVS